MTEFPRITRDPAVMGGMAVRCVRVVQRMAGKYTWFTPCVNEFRMLRIEENNDLRVALTDDDED